MMRTDDLINMLASGPDVHAPAVPLRSLVLPIAAGTLVSAALMFVFLGVRHNLDQAVMVPAFWVKILFVGALVWIGKVAGMRLAMPGTRLGLLPALIAAPFLIIWSVAAVTMIDAAPGERALMFWGSTWRYCPLLIAMLSLPILIAVLKVMRGLAPTRLHLAGAAAGLAAGATGAAVYCLHCPEIEAAFIGFWYVLGISIPTMIGALVGPRVLRW